MAKTIASGALVFCLAGVGCGGSNRGQAPPPNTDPVVDALEDPAHPGIEACSSGFSAVQIDDNLEIARNFRESAHEMVVCGGLSAALTTTFFDILFNAATGSSTGPNGFTYDGAGSYDAGQVMSIRLYLGADTSFGAAGDPITFDVFDLTNYADGLKVTAEATINSSGEATTSFGLSFANPGPGLELLGFPPGAPSPLTVDFDAIAAAVGKHELEIDVVVNDTFDNSGTTVLYQLTSTQRTSLGQIWNGGQLPMDLEMVTGARPATGQSLSVNDWIIEYTDTGNGVLDGTISLDVVGSSLFDFVVTYDYPYRGAPDVSLACK